MGILIGFVGIALILRPSQQIFSTASCIALVSGILAALAIVEMRIVSKTSSVTQMLFYYFLVSTMVSGIVAAGQWQTAHRANLVVAFRRWRVRHHLPSLRRISLRDCAQ